MVRAEEQLQRSVVQLLALYAGRGLLAFCHVPNGERRDRITGARLKAMGVQPGVPDLLVWTPHGKSFGIEMKAGRGQLSDVQVLWRSTPESLGHRVYVCWSLEEVEAVLRLEGVPPVGEIVRPHPAALPRALEAS